MRPKPLISLAIFALWLFTLPRIALAQAAPRSSLDVVLALDNSGSMKKNDPNSLMRQAVSEFASRLAPDSRMGIVLFDQSVRGVLDLLPAGDVTFHSRVDESLRLLDYRGQLTDIPGGVERAIYALRQSTRPSAQRVIVLFTDGIVETGNPAKDVERSRWLRENLAADAKRLGIRVFGIAFTETADFQLMQSLAEATDGEYFRVLSAPDIPPTFAKISARLRDLGSGPLPPPPPPPLWQRLLRWPYLLGAGAVVALFFVLALLVGRRRTAASLRPSILAHLRDMGGYAGAEILPLDKLVTRIGRDEGGNDIVIAQDTVSTKHAVIEFRDGAFHLRDLRSSNGSFLNGKQFSEPNDVREVVLKHGDKLRFDAFEFEFVEDALEGVQQTRLADDAAVGAGFGVGAGGTHLRGGPPPVAVDPGQPPYGPMADPPATIHKPPEPQPGAGADGPATRLKPDMCPHHPAWKATELCPVCGIPKCKSCMTQKDGKPICNKCVAEQAA